MSYRPAEPLANPIRSYAVRLSYPDDEIPQEFWNCIASLGGGVFATVHRDTDKEHVHMAVWNVGISHDAFRKKLIDLVKQFINEDPPKGNALMSVKKWKDGSEKYLVYMLKGERHDVIDNSIYLRPEYIQHLRDLWIEGEQEQTTAYNLWKLAEYFPKKTEEIVMVDGEPMRRLVDTTSDTILKSAKRFVLERQKKVSIDSAVRFLTKDLISNYCHYNDFKMFPVYI